MGRGAPAPPGLLGSRLSPLRPAAEPTARPTRTCSAVIATAAAASARSVRGPSVSGTQPALRATSTSSAVHPPSGPTMSRAEAGAGSARGCGRRRHRPTVQARLGQQEAAGGRDATEAPCERLGPMDGGHDGAAALLHGRDRDPLPAVHAPRSLQAAEAHLGPRRTRAAGWPPRRASTASRTIRSIPSPLGTAWTSVSRTDGSAAGVTSPSRVTVAAARLTWSTRPAELAAASVEHPHRVADPQPEHSAEVLRLVARKVDDGLPLESRARRSGRASA